MISVEGLTAFARALDALASERLVAPALEVAAERLVQGVRSVLSHPPGSEHATPWLETGALRDSISARIGPDGAVVGSTSMVAVDQEQGTKTVPPRPFLAPVAMREAADLVTGFAEDLARTIGEAR